MDNIFLLCDVRGCLARKMVFKILFRVEQPFYPNVLILFQYGVNYVIIIVAGATQYYVDESGQYYFHNPETTTDGHIMTVVQSIDPQGEMVDDENEDYMEVEDMEEEKKTLQVSG